LLIIVSSPLMLLVAIAIKIESRWPIIYKAKRVGKYGKLFTFIKFRSMYTHLSIWYWGKDAETLYQKLINSDANVRQWVLPKIKNDPRVTKVGKFIRKTSLDELPQLFCSLRGTMSLIGPRPHLPNEVENYESRQKRLFSIKPGLTWYAQVFGRDDLDFEEEAKLDLYYIQNRTIFMDMYILFATFGVAFKWK
jgi:lipopolysaccharide/colanic/teichoic acid biosynthesis glycosyltransferase